MSPASAADRVVDDLLPDDFDWTDLVVRYPKTSILVAAVGGYLLGRTRGEEIVDSLGGFATDKVTEGVNHYLGQKVL